MRVLLYDLRYALRALRRNPVLAAVAVLSLGIGIGANTAIFTLLDGMLLRALPVPQPGRLVVLASPGGWSGNIDTSYGDEVTFSMPKYRALSDRTGSLFEGLLARTPFGASIAARSETERADGELVSGNYFALLGVRPVLGRLIGDDDARTRGANPVVVLSYGYWNRRFGGDPGVLNQSIVVNGHPLTVVGVTQSGFRSIGAGEAPAIFVPITLLSEMKPGWNGFDNPHAYILNIFGRLKPGISRAQAQTAVAAAWSAILAEDGQSLSARQRERYLKKVLELRPGGSGISMVRDDFALPLYLLMGMVGMVLLIACANVANLLLGRAAARSKEIAIRLSLGATRGRLVRHLLAESLLLAVGGGLLGLMFSSWTAGLLLRLIPSDKPTAGLTGDADARILAFTAVVSLLTAILFGLAPAIRGSRVDLGISLKEQSGMPSTGGHARFRKVLVAGQIAVSVLLLASAGLFARSLHNLRTLNPGFRTDHLETFSIAPRLNGYDRERVLRLFDGLRGGLESTPGVLAVSMAKWPLLTNSINISSYKVEGYLEQPSATLNENHVGPRFFSVMGIPLLVGRDIRESDNPASTPVAVINETAARKYFAGRSPLGLHLTRGRIPVAAEIVGVVQDSKADDLRETPKAMIYLPASQDASPGVLTFYVRTQLSGDAFATGVRQLVRGFDANLPVMGPKPIAEEVAASLIVDRMVAALSAAFAVLATVLAALGLYGVIAWAVTRRQREIGIRMALGASPAVVLRMVVREVLTLTGIGIAIAAPLWAVTGAVLKTLLFGVAPFDVVTLLAAVAVLTTVATAAGFIPAWRASRISPTLAMRE